MYVVILDFEKANIDNMLLLAENMFTFRYCSRSCPSYILIEKFEEITSDVDIRIINWLIPYEKH